MKKGVAEYHTVFIARTDSAISSLDGLAGKTIAFEDAGSTSAFLVPAYVFAWVPWRSMIWMVGVTATVLMLLSVLL